MLGQMPDPDYADNSRKTTKTKSSRKYSEITSPNPSKQSRKKDAPVSAPSLKKKFEEHGKRRVIDDFLKTPKKPSVAPDLPLKLQTARERKMTVINNMRDAPLKMRYTLFMYIIN